MSPSRWVAAIVAVTACIAGFAIALFLTGGTGIPTAAATSSPSPAARSDDGGGTLRITLIGKVLAVSRTSVTIGGDGPPVTGHLTGSTRVTGKITSVDGIKVGDQISAQLTGTAMTSLTFTSIQDPA